MTTKLTIKNCEEKNPNHICQTCNKKITRYEDMKENEFAAFILLQICVDCFMKYHPDSECCDAE